MPSQPVSGAAEPPSRGRPLGVAPGRSVGEVAAIQRRTMRSLLIAQVLGSIAITAGFAMGSLIMEYVTGSTTVAGLAQAATTLGSAVMAVPAARIAMRSGRRPSLATTYAVATTGAALVVVGSAASRPLIVLVGMFLFGAGTAASMQIRFTGLDLATPATRGRTLSVLLFAVTIGGVVGPNLARPTGAWAEAMGLPKFAGPFFVSVALLFLAAVAIGVLLRPDPLRIARERSATPVPGIPVKTLGMWAAIKVMFSSAPGRIGSLAVVGAHATMVSVMVMTPVHIGHTGHGLDVVGFIISGHVIGMYAFSPVMGFLADRYGARTTVLLGAAILLAACALSGFASDSAVVQLGVGLFLLGLGWSACLVGGSVLVTASAEEHQRPSVQGASDMLMGLGAALIASLSGLIVAVWSYATLALIAAILVVPMLVALGVEPRRSAAE